MKGRPSGVRVRSFTATSPTVAGGGEVLIDGTLRRISTVVSSRDRSTANGATRHFTISPQRRHGLARPLRKQARGYLAQEVPDRSLLRMLRQGPTECVVELFGLVVQRLILLAMLLKQSGDRRAHLVRR